MIKKQKVILSGIALSTIGVTSLVLKDKSRRHKIEDAMKKVKRKMMTFMSKEVKLDNFPVKKAGHPDPHDIDDNKMVSEGAMYAVQYYDEKKQ